MDLSGVSIDSRTIEPGDLFVALSGDPGPRFGSVTNARDGHDFAQMAVKAGAAAVMCRADFTGDYPLIPVADTLEGLWQLGAAARARFEGQVVAITGSSGKTTMRGWLEQLLAPVGEVHASVGSYNNHWGVPLSLARMPRDREFGVLEVGTNHPGEIAPLSELVQPDVALLLNVLPAHIGNFNDMQALTDEKLSIAAGLPEGGTLVVPFELRNQVSHARLLTFGSDPESDVTGSLVGDQFVVTQGDSQLTLEVPWKSPERLSAILASLGVLMALGVDPSGLEQCFAMLDLPEGRGNQQTIAEITVIDDSYNANPASMKMALEQLHRSDRPGRRIALLGEMLELGSQTASAHADMALKAEGLDQVLTFGQGFESAAIGAHFATIDDFDLDGFVAELRGGDTVLVKGSNKVFWSHQFVRRLLKLLDARA